MKKRKLIALITSICMVLVLAVLSLTTECAPSAPSATEQKAIKEVSIAGGSIGGSTNLIANAYAGLVKEFMGVDATVLTYPMAGIPPAVQDRVVNIGITATLDSYYSWYAKDLYQGQKPTTDLREILPRSTTPLQMFVRADSPIKTFRDLVGKRISPGTAAMAPAKQLERGCPAMGLDFQKDFKISYMSHQEGGAALAGGKIDCYMAGAPPPHPTLMETDLTSPIRLIGFNDKDLAALLSTDPTLGRAVVPPKYYHMTEEIQTTTYVGQVCTYPEFPDDFVYNFLKVIIEHNDFIGYYYKIYQEYMADPFGARQDVKQTVSPVPFHKAAVRYYKEIGWEIPANRLPPEK